MVVEVDQEDSIGLPVEEDTDVDPWFRADGPVLPAGIFICETTFDDDEYVEIVLVALWVDGNIRPPLDEPEELEIHEIDDVTAAPPDVVVDALDAPEVPPRGYLEESYIVDVTELMIEVVVPP